MKIIKDNYSAFPRQETCKHCDSIIELEDENDVEFDGDYFADDKGFEWECPCCKETNYLYLPWEN